MALGPEEQEALSALTSLLSHPDALLVAWQEQDLFNETESDGLEVRIGEKASPALAALIQRYEASTRRQFPSFLGAILSTLNGFDVQENTEGRMTVTKEPSVEDAWNGFLRAEEIELHETPDGLSALRFSVAYAQCSVLLVDEGPRRGAVIFVDGKGPAFVLADTLPEFVRELTQTGLSVEGVAAKRM